MSSSDWPASWDKNHESLCGLSGVSTKLALKRGERYVELFKWNASMDQSFCIGGVPEAIDWKTLMLIIPVMIDSYDRGYANGQADLAAEVQKPIKLALEKRM